MHNYIRMATPVVLTIALSGCALLPGEGPYNQTVTAKASTTLKNEEGTLGYDYALVDVTRAKLPFLAQPVETGQFRSFGAAARTGPPSIRLGPGDVIRVSVFESQTGGLFLPQDAGARPGNFVQLPPQRIDENGSISVPFAGTIRAQGQTPSAVGETIRARLADRAIEPEISVEIVEQNFSRVSVIGDVGTNGTFPVAEGGVRVLEMIARAGGVQGDASAAFVTLTRGGRSVKVSYRSITRNPAENIFLAPGDVLEVTDEEQTFFAFGATGLVGNFDFEDETVTLNQAVARVASLQQARADPRNVLIYRIEHRHTLERMGVDVSEMIGYEVPTIYNVNYRAPDIFFLANEFQMRDGDVVYVSNSPITELSRFFSGVRTVTRDPRVIASDIEGL